MTGATREVFGNITPAMRAGFYLMIFASLGVMGLQIRSRAKLWWLGQSGPIHTNWRVILRRFLVQVVGQQRVRKKSLGGFLHLLLFSGFVVLSIGTTILAIHEYGPIKFYHGWFYLIYKITMDLFGLALCVGCVLAIYRRAVARPASLGHRADDWLVLGLLLAMGTTGFLIESLRLRYTQVQPDIGRWSVVGWTISRTLLRSLPIATARRLHLITWWTHTVMVAIFFMLIPRTRLFHILTAPANIAIRPSRHAGALAAIDMAQVEQTGRVGVDLISQFTRQQLFSLDSCMECGRCEEVCPAFATHKPLSPKKLILDLRHAMENSAGSSLHESAISADTLWACTMCQACVYECPATIGHVDFISDMRRHLVSEGRFSGPPAKSVRHVASQFNPYGQPNSERFAWADGLDVPTVESNPGFEYLFWVGCAASFDPRTQKVARATVQLFRQAGLNFAVLATQERCTGDPARRLGEELLFRELAENNIQTLAKFKVKKIVTACPHCLNTFTHEYPQLGGKYVVMHHSQVLAKLVEEEKIAGGEKIDGGVTLHDPCYLARVNGDTESARAILPQDMREMERHGRKTSCCGGGGGRMWFEEPPEQRVSRQRAAEALSTGAKTVATACPFCLNMMTDGVAGSAGGENVQVLDIAELLVKGKRVG
jgi:Fe-S oxidoreductase/nitrate reductase gamma subunit